ncbi:IclR family transcriptional regulator C-terminal domain-containing protein [Desulfosarcina ovata]|uniref:IclR family transcriptional regulator domain-containing protein n=1 Tax=Desulfosarcina ovata TaxID=83564 RepID=UPI0039C95B61
MDVLEQELDDTIKIGYACENQELRKGICRVVAPIFDHTAKLAGGIGVAAPAFRIGVEDFPKIGELVKSIAISNA